MKLFKRFTAIILACGLTLSMGISSGATATQIFPFNPIKGYREIPNTTAKTALSAESCTHFKRNIKVLDENGDSETFEHAFWIKNTSNTKFYMPCTVEKTQYNAIFECATCGETLGKAPMQYKYLHKAAQCPFLNEAYALKTPQPEANDEEPFDN